MKIIDITGVIQEGMWNYEFPFPEFKLKKLPKVPWIKDDIYCEIFEGLHSQTGTYFETPAHNYGNSSSYLTNDVSVEKLVNIPCVVLNIVNEKFNNPESRISIEVEDLEDCLNHNKIQPGDAVLVGVNWGSRWMHESYLKNSPYFTNAAMEWLISKRPYLLGSDVPRWENLENPQGFFPKFYKSNILMLAPCVNLEQVKKDRVQLTVLPLKIAGTSTVPCRAVIIEA